MQTFTDLFFAPIRPIVDVILTQAKDVIAVRLKPLVLAFIALLDEWQGVPVYAVAFDDKAGVFDHEVADKSPHWLLRFISRVEVAEPFLNGHFNPGSLSALMIRRPRALALTGAKARPFGKRGFGFVSFPAVLAHKNGGGLIKMVLGSPDCSFPFIQTIIGAKSTLVFSTTGPYPKLLAACFAVTIDAVLGGICHALARLRPASARTVTTAALAPGKRNGNSEGFLAHFTSYIGSVFKTLVTAFSRAIELVSLRFFTAAICTLIHHSHLKAQDPGCTISLSRRRGCRGLAGNKYIQFYGTYHIA